jgi:hypothetical protein
MCKQNPGARAPLNSTVRRQSAVLATNTNALLGCWHLRSADARLGLDDVVEMDFQPSGDLLYCIDAGPKWQVTRLRFRVEGETIVTDQPSHPGEERTGFELDNSGALVLDYGGLKAHFVKGTKRCPVV